MPVGVFWLNIAKFKVNWCYRYCFKLFSNLRKEKELRQYHCWNSTTVGERKIKSRREKFLIFGNGIVAIPSAHSAARVGARNVNACKENQMTWEKKNWQLWQCHCQNRWYKFLAIMAMALPKMEKKNVRKSVKK